MPSKQEKVLEYIDKLNFSEEEKAELAAKILDETNLGRGPMICFIHNLSENAQSELHCRINDFMEAQEEET